MVRLPGIVAVAATDGALGVHKAAGVLATPRRRVVVAAPSRVENAAADAPHEVLREQLRLSEDLSVQLKTVVRAQHEQIEKLRICSAGEDEDEATCPSFRIQMRMLEQYKREGARLREEQGQLKAQVSRLTNQLKSLSRANEDLRRMNKRLSGIIAQAGYQTPAVELREGATLASPNPFATTCVSPPTGARLANAPVKRASPRPWFGGRDDIPALSPSPPASVAGVSRHADLIRNVFALCREESPCGLLAALLEGAWKLVDGSSATPTLYVVDPWISKEMADSASNRCRALHSTTFYMAGKVAVHAFQQNGSRPDAPGFKTLDALPMRGSGNVLALPLQARRADPILAVIQVVTSLQKDSVGPADSRLTDVQISGLDLLSKIVARFLDLYLRVDVAKHMMGRSRECLGIATGVNGAQNLTDFEQRAKTFLTRFFGVATVRVSFYENSSQQIIVDADAPNEDAAVVGRRALKRIAVKEGVIGLCVRRQQIVHLDRMMASPAICEDVDGVNLTGKSGEANMLAGPMVVSFVDEPERVIGVVQLIGKQRRQDIDVRAGGSMEERLCRCEPFSAEDRELFPDLLNILGLAAFRTMQAQSFAGLIESPPADAIFKLLGG